MSGGGEHRDAAAALSFIGTKLGSYELVELLGEGGMGWVYLARHVTIGRRVAIKMLRPELANHPIALSRFFAEAHVVNRISHENIIEVYDFVSGGDDGMAYLVLESLEGRDLLALIHSGEPIPLERALAIMVQVARALGAAHVVGVVHRDLKPENIYLTRRGDQEDFVKLLDFGIAKLRHVESSTRLTQVGTSLGTPAYISPEQALGADVDHRTDIYSFGVILYELATGVLPFPSDSVADMVSRHVLEQPRRPCEIDQSRSKVPARLEDLIMQCLAKGPDDRPASMAEVEEALEGVRAQLAGQAATPPAESAVSPPSPAARKRRRKLLVPVLVGCLGAAGLGAAAVHGLGGARDPSEVTTVRAATPMLPEPEPAIEQAPEPQAAQALEPAAEPAPEAEPPAPTVDARRQPAPVRKAPARAVRRTPPTATATAPAHTTVEPPAPDDATRAPAPAPPPASPPPPAASARQPAPPPPAVERGSFDAIPSLARVSAIGLPRAEIEGAMQRVNGSLRGCYRDAARRAGRTPSLSLTIAFEIDEGGAARHVRVTGDTLGVAGCVAAAVGKLRSRVSPDVGRASAVAILSFQPTR